MYRERAQNVGQHRRTPDQVASLMIAWRTFLRFAVAVKAISKDEQSRLMEEGWRALTNAAAGQAAYQTTEDPVRRFLDLIRTALATGAAYLDDPSPGGAGLSLPPITRHGTKIGWQPHNRHEAWLLPDAAFALAQDMARRQGDPIGMTQETLWKRMAERGLLMTEKGRNTVKRQAEDKRHRVLCLNPDHLNGEEAGQAGRSGRGGEEASGLGAADAPKAERKRERAGRAGKSGARAPGKKRRRGGG
ncbi:hypothetical protein BH24DEI1_BH24DEI1_08240 [soil metagenome]